MNLKAVLTVSSLYLAILGIGFMLVPRAIGIEAVPPDPSAALVAYLRVLGGPFLGIAVLNWLSRNERPSSARNAIVIANIAGFACVSMMDIWGVFSGAARPIAKIFLVIHLGMTVAFLGTIRVGRRSHGQGA